MTNPWAALHRTGPRPRAPHRPYIRAEGYAYLTAARDAGQRGLCAGDVAKTMTVQIECIRVTLLRMTERGLLRRVSRGAYAISTKGKCLMTEFEKRMGIAT